MKRILQLILILCCIDLQAQINRKICISVDDLPLVRYGIKGKAHEWDITNGILDAFKKYDVPAIGYVNAGKLFPEGQLDSSRITYVEQWLKEGFEIGNHTYSHKNYHRVSFDEYTRDILEGEKIVKALVESYDRKYEYFRHPYLRSGENDGATKRLKVFLKEHGYQEAFVTIDDDDYLFALAYSRAYRRNDMQLMERIGEAYLEYMVKKLVYFEKCSIELFGRNINHTLLIHANFLNAQYLDQLLALYKELGYSFISQKEAVQDPAYETEVTKFGDWGISWIHKWGMSVGKGNEFFKGDPETPLFIKELAE